MTKGAPVYRCALRNLNPRDIGDLFAEVDTQEIPDVSGILVALFVSLVCQVGLIFVFFVIVVTIGAKLFFALGFHTADKEDRDLI